MSLGPDPRQDQSRFNGVFATTNWSIVLASAADDTVESRVALEALCRAYWKPIYVFTRRFVPSAEAAQDLTQDFFARLLTKNLFAIADPAKGRFRTFLLTLLK